MWMDGANLSGPEAARRAGVSVSTVHRILTGAVDPSVGTLREIALACGIDFDLTGRVVSDPLAAAAARGMLERGYQPLERPGIGQWRERLLRIAGASDPVAIVTAAAQAAAPLRRQGVLLYAGHATIARIASAGDASKARWAVSGAAGLYLPPADSALPPVTVLWCEDMHPMAHLLTDTDLQRIHRPAGAVLAVVAGEPELFANSFTQGIVQYAAPAQIIMDCLSQGGALADEATQEAASW